MLQGDTRLSYPERMAGERLEEVRSCFVLAEAVEDRNFFLTDVIKMEQRAVAIGEWGGETGLEDQDVVNLPPRTSTSTTRDQPSYG